MTLCCYVLCLASIKKPYYSSKLPSTVENCLLGKSFMFFSPLMMLTTSMIIIVMMMENPRCLLKHLMQKQNQKQQRTQQGEIIGEEKHCVVY